MPLRRGQPLTFRPGTLTDAVDGTNAPAGAMASLSNLIPDPRTAAVYVPRPAAVAKAVFSGSATIPHPAGFISGLLAIGDLVYGVVSSGLNAGHDQPFCYDLASGAFRLVNGITAANTPTSPPVAGDWTPPILARVGSRIVVTHPGFPGGTVKFGWFDISGFTEATTGNLTVSSPTISGNPAILGVQPGMTVVGVDIPAGATVVGTSSFALATTGTLHAATTVDGLPGTVGIRTGMTVVAAGVTPGTTVAGVIGASAIALSAAATAEQTGVAVYIKWNTTGDTHTNAIIDNIADMTGVALGQLVSGPGVPAGSTVIEINSTASSITISNNTTATAAGVALEFLVATVGDTHLGTTADHLADTTGVVAGNLVAGLAVPPGTTVVSVNSPTSITMSAAATADISGVGLFFSGSTITMSANAAGSHTAESITVAGGTATAPLWGAGDMDRNALPSVPVGVAQFNGRAYYACGTDGIVFSDSGFACRRSDTLGVQVLTTNDGLAVTAVFPLMLSAPLVTTGIVQALIAFQSTAKMQQITGDPATGNLSMNALPVATGTAAPLSLFACEMGTGFVSPEGLRFIKFDGGVSEPLGDAGQGVTAPFIFSVYPSRMCASANSHTIRITTQNGADPAQPTEEYWYDIGRRVWTGPHTFPCSLAQPWRSTFIVAPVGRNGQLWQADVTAGLNSTYVEGMRALTWTFLPAPLPDSGQLAMNALVDMTVGAQIPAGTTLQFAASDIDGLALDVTTVVATATATLWGHFNWGSGLWGGTATNFQQYAVQWHVPLTFKQLLLSVTGPSGGGLRIGNLYMRYQILGYKLQVVA